MSVSRSLFRVLLFTVGPLSVFTILAPRSLLERTHVYLWSWLLVLPAVCWLAEYVRSLYRGGE